MKFSQMDIDLTELLQEIAVRAPHIRNTAEVERWIKTSSERIFTEYKEDVFPAIVRGERGEITPQEIKRQVESKLKSEINKKLSLNPWDVAAIYASSIGQPIQIKDETIDARAIVSSKLFQDSAGAWDDSMKGYMQAVEDAKAKFYVQSAELQLREMTKINTKINTKEHGGMEDYPWFDPGMVTLCKNGVGEVYLLDYAMPSSKDDADAIMESTPERYINKMSLKVKFIEDTFGIKIDKPTLIVSKYMGNGRTTILNKNLANQVSRDVAGKMLESADYCYKNNILEERLPQVDYGDSNFTRMTEMPKALKSAVAKYVVMNKLKTLTDKSASSAKAVIKEIAESTGAFSEHKNGSVSPGKELKSKLAMGPLSVSSKKTLILDKSELIAQIMDAGLTPVEMPSIPSYEDMLLEQYLTIPGTSIEDPIIYIIKDEQRFNVTRSAKHNDIDIVQLAEQLANDHANEALDVLIDNFDLLTEEEEAALMANPVTSPEAIEEFKEKLEEKQAAPDLSASFDF